MEAKVFQRCANPIAEEVKKCVALQAQYLYDSYGKAPATVPSIFLLTYLQAQHIDLDFYDHCFKAGKPVLLINDGISAIFGFISSCLLSLRLSPFFAFFLEAIKLGF